MSIKELEPSQGRPTMSRQVRGREVKEGGFSSWLGFVLLFGLSLLLFCSFLLVGCNQSQTGVAGVNEAQGAPPEARKAILLRSLNRKYENPVAHYELGKIYQAEGQWSKAEQHYNIAISFDPAYRQAQAAMVKLFFDSGDSAKAKNYADIYMNQVSASASQSLKLALAFQKQMLDEYALACYQQALQLAPNSPAVYKHLGYYYLSKGDKVRAREYLSRSFQLDPKQPEVAGELGRLGVEVRIPGKTETSTKKPEEIVEQSRNEG
jgi:tetratricopeptide (TPR) repeat protein